MNSKQLLAAAIGAALVLGAVKAPEVYAFGMGREGARFGGMGAIAGKKGIGGTPPPSCSGAGQLDFSDTCQTAIMSALL